MPFYVQRGSIPSKRHTQYRQPDGSLYKEEHVSRLGFSDIYSNLYHIHPPTEIIQIKGLESKSEEIWETSHSHRHFRTAKVKSEGDVISSRRTLLFNNDVSMQKAHVDKSMTNFYRNAHHDEVIFVHRGKGTLHSNYGDLTFGFGDYIVIPRGVIWKMEISEPCRFLIIETAGPVETPNRYRNKHGQLTEWAPYCERDIRTPEFVEPVDETGEFELQVKLQNGIQTYIYKNHLFNLIGWDGYFYPWIFNINDFMPITGKVHQPPPVHQTFQAPGLVICSFCPRLFDYHPDAIPAPYAHSNVDSEEVIYYVEGKFMSRQSVEEESITFHPMGSPHGPQPGKTEESIGAKETAELAVMVDTFRPFKMSISCKDIDDPEYPLSWVE